MKRVFCTNALLGTQDKQTETAEGARTATELLASSHILTIKLDELRQPVTTLVENSLRWNNLEGRLSSRNFNTKQPLSHGKEWDEQDTPHAFQPEGDETQSVSQRPKENQRKISPMLCKVCSIAR